ELQVQPLYQLSEASLTAPMCVVVSKKGSSVLASKAVTLASAVPFTNRLTSVGVKLVLFPVPAVKAASTSAAVNSTPAAPVPRNFVLLHCIATACATSVARCASVPLPCMRRH